MNARLTIALIAIACAPACGRGAKPPLESKQATVAAAPGGTGARRLSVAITFDAGSLHVRIAASGDRDDLRAWQLGEDVVERLEVRDVGERVLAFKRDGRRIELAGAVATTVLAYDVKREEKAYADADADAQANADTNAGAMGSEEARATRIESSRFRAVGDAILALPAAFEGKSVAVSLDVSAKDAAVVATSFGVAREHVARQLTISPAVLRRAAFFAGPGGRAEFDAPEGHDEAAWLGYPAFDPRAVAAEVAGFRGLLHDYFKDYDLEPATLLFAVDARPRGHFRVARRAAGVLVTLSSDPYDAPLRLAIAHELVHAWIGERIWLGDATPGREAGAFWFHEGFTRWVAREQLARAGLLSPDEYAAEVDRLLAIVTTSRHGSRSMTELAADRAAPGVVPLLMARGALFATVEDARIREVSKGARTLDDVVRDLAKQAGEKSGPLPENALRDRLVGELGEARAREDFEDVVAVGRRTKLPENALGPCFEAREVAYGVYAPGFDVAGSRAAHAIVGLEVKGPAALAGLRERDILVSADIPDRADQTAKVEVERDGKRVMIGYAPTSGTRRGQGFRRKPALTDDGCRKLALRR